MIVLGGGSAGTSAAGAATAAGARTLMINDGELGGLCILRGCMPTKTLLHAAHLAHGAGHSETDGIEVLGARIDFEQGFIHGEGPLKGDEVFLAGPFGSTVLGTANVMMAGHILFPGGPMGRLDLVAFLQREIHQWKGHAPTTSEG